MSARALISGRIWRDPEHRVSSAGKSFGSASLRVGNGNAVIWWKVLTFSESGIEELLSLRDGDALSASGEFKAEAYDRGAGPKVGFTLFADRIISARRAKKQHQRGPINATEAQRPIESGFNDDLPESWR
jgi:hypothetical protein